MTTLSLNQQILPSAAGSKRVDAIRNGAVA